MIQPENLPDVEQVLRRAAHLLEMGTLEDAGEHLQAAAQSAFRLKDARQLARAHESLGDLTMLQGESMAAVFHYRTASRLAGGEGAIGPEQKLQGALAARAGLPAFRQGRYIALRRDYTYGVVTLSAVDRLIFTKRYFTHCMACNFCHDGCCDYGVDIDLPNVRRIQAVQAELAPHLRPSEGSRFLDETWYDEQYAGSEYTRTAVSGGKCAFINREGRGCGLHAYALAQGTDYHEIKPLLCVLFPLTYEQEMLYLSAEVEDDSLVCLGPGGSAYRGIRAELEYYFGAELVEELDGIERGIFAAES